jgi:membrane associated rhomboid family serine protease
VFPIKDNIPTSRTPVITIAIIVANVVVYLLSIRHGGNFLSGPTSHEAVRYGVIPYEFTHWGKHCDLVSTSQVICEGQRGVVGHAPHQPATWVTAFTSMFMHGGLLHIGGNMLFLWIFGNNVEDSMGRVKFVAFYFIAGLCALGGQIIIGPNTAVPLVGASGAIAGVLGGYILLYPRARVLTLVFIILFFTIIEIPAILFLGIWFAEQILFGAASLTNPTGGGGGVAYFAHVGGFLFGVLAIKAFAQRRAAAAGTPRYPVY